MIDISFDAILADAKAKKVISALPTNPKQKIEFVRQYFKKQKESNG